MWYTKVYTHKIQQIINKEFPAASIARVGRNVPLPILFILRVTRHAVNLEGLKNVLVLSYCNGNFMSSIMSFGK